MNINLKKLLKKLKPNFNLNINTIRYLSTYSHLF